MRNITKYILISACTLMLNSCDAYLDKQPDDAMTMEMIFQKRASTQKYLVNVFSYMIDESHRLPEQQDHTCALTSHSNKCA